jgi:hypothetical protein
MIFLALGRVVEPALALPPAYRLLRFPQQFSAR